MPLKMSAESLEEMMKLTQIVKIQYNKYNAAETDTDDSHNTDSDSAAAPKPRMVLKSQLSGFALHHGLSESLH